MKTYIETRPEDEKAQVKIDVTNMKESEITEVCNVLTGVSKTEDISVGVKDLEPVSGKIYRHVCYHDGSNKPCELVE